MSPVTQWFEGLSPLASALIVVGTPVIVTIGAGRLIRRYGSNELLAEHNELAGFIFAVVGVVYAVVLGFISIGVWERFGEASVRTYAEADALVSTYRNVGPLPGGAAVRADIRTYVEEIISKAWPDMVRGVHSHKTDAEAERVAADLERIRPRNAAEQTLQRIALASLDNAFDDRDMRLGWGVTGLNTTMWIVVFIGGAITVGFSLFFGFRSALMQSLMTGTLAFMIGLIIYLTLSLDYPYTGAVRVGPDAFQGALITFSEIDAAER